MASAAGRAPATWTGLPGAILLLGAASFAVARLVPVLDVHLPCPFRSATGLPCATCGMTHAFVAMARGDVASAWGASPLGALIAAGAWLLAVAVLLRPVLGIPVPRLSPRAARGLAVAALVAAALNWAWMLHRSLAA